MWCSRSRDPAPARDALLLIADNDVGRREELRGFFRGSGFQVAVAANGLECLAELAVVQPDVLIVAMQIPWGGGDGVLARLREGLPMRRRPIVLVMGDSPPQTLSERTGLPLSNCFSQPVCAEEMLDRIGIEFAARLLYGAHRVEHARQARAARALIKGGVR